MEIPGLIQGEDKKNPKMTEAEVQAMRTKFAHQVKKEGALNNSLPYSMTFQQDLNLQQVQDYYGYGINDFGYLDQINEYKKTFIPQPNKGLPPFQEPNPLKKYGPSPSRHGSLGEKEDWERQLLEYMKSSKPKKSAFEELLDGMFSVEDKIEFLKNTGYEIEVTPQISITKKLASGEVKTITNTLDDLFLKEMTVKFKNLLMMKATLKLKL